LSAAWEDSHRSNTGLQPNYLMDFHFAESAANILTNSALDPVAKTPEFKVCAVRVEKLRRQK
jgi:predicted molibdopterin-dependent oxidoreductase YjgC